MRKLNKLCVRSSFADKYQHDNINTAGNSKTLVIAGEATMWKVAIACFNVFTTNETNSFYKRLKLPIKFPHSESAAAFSYSLLSLTHFIIWVPVFSISVRVGGFRCGPSKWTEFLACLRFAHFFNWNLKSQEGDSNVVCFLDLGIFLAHHSLCNFVRV